MSTLFCILLEQTCVIYLPTDVDSSNSYGFAFNISTQILSNYVNGSRSSGVYSIPDCALTQQVGPYVVTYTGLISKTPTAFHIDWLHNKMYIRLVKRSGEKKTLAAAGA